MLKVTIDPEQLQTLINDSIDKAIERHGLKNSLPPMLDRKHLMEFFDVGSNKVTEMFNRQDFPVLREFGHPRVPTHLLFKWIDEHTEWVRENTKFFGRSA